MLQNNIHSKMAPKQGNNYVLYFQKGKKKDLRAEHDSSVKNLEKLILTPLVTVIDCQFLGLLSMQGIEQCWSYSVL